MLVGLIILILAFSPYIYHLWLGDTVKVPFTLSLVITVYFILTTWNSIYVLFINGVGKIRLQLFAAIVESIIFIPLALLFSKTFNLGIAGIVMASCLPLFVGAFWTRMQFMKIINNRATGIWNR
jgi:Na+-driven multidrug efflux pump